MGEKTVPDEIFSVIEERKFWHVFLIWSKSNSLLLLLVEVLDKFGVDDS